MKDKTANDNYYLLTLAALAQEIRKRKGKGQRKLFLQLGFPYRVWKGKTEIQGVSVSEGTANPFLI